jgi:hypothetical protein
MYIYRMYEEVLHPVIYKAQWIACFTPTDEKNVSVCSAASQAFIHQVRRLSHSIVNNLHQIEQFSQHKKL